MLNMVPAVYNYNSIGYNPDVLSAEEANTWAAIFDREMEGQIGPQHRSFDRLRPGHHGNELARAFQRQESRQPDRR